MTFLQINQNEIIHTKEKDDVLLSYLKVPIQSIWKAIYKRINIKPLQKKITDLIT